MIWAKNGLGNGLLPDGTKPSPEPMLTNHQSGPLVSQTSNTKIRAKFTIHQVNSNPTEAKIRGSKL